MDENQESARGNSMDDEPASPNPSQATRRRTKKKPVLKRFSTWLGAVVVAGLAAGTTAVVQNQTEQSLTAAFEAFAGPAQVKFKTSSGPLVNVNIDPNPSVSALH